MKRIPVIVFLLFSGLLCALPSGASERIVSAPEEFIQGNIAYGNGEYASAEEAYRSVLRSGSSARVHFNLGNALAQQDRWSEAAFHFLRARSLDPHFEAASGNLLLAARELRLEDPFPMLPGPANLLGRAQWVLLAALSFWVAVFLFLHQHLVPFHIPLARTLATMASLLLLLAFAALHQHQRFLDWTVVAADAVPLRVAPTEQSPAEATLARGSPVRIRQSHEAFVHVITPSGNEGFLRLEEVYRSGFD